MLGGAPTCHENTLAFELHARVFSTGQDSLNSLILLGFHSLLRLPKGPIFGYNTAYFFRTQSL